MAQTRRKPTQTPGQLNLAGMNGAVAGTDLPAPRPSRAFVTLLSEGKGLSSTESPESDKQRRVARISAAKAATGQEPYRIADWKADLAFCAREFVLVTLPHSDPGNVDIFQRRNGRLTLTIQSGYDTQRRCKAGIPYGTVPRLFMYYANTQVITNPNQHDRRIAMGRNLTEFLRELGFESESRGRHSSAHICREQMTRLLLARLTYHTDTPRADHRQKELEALARKDLLVSSKSVLWWDSQDDGSPWQGESWIELSREFHEMMRQGPIPVRMSVLHAIKKSPLALDLYALLTRESARAAETGKPRFISWPLLMGQIGSEYKEPKDFGKKVRAAIEVIRKSYPKLKVDYLRGGMTIRPDSLPDIEPRKVR